MKSKIVNADFLKQMTVDIVSAQITNAYYSALLLKQSSGNKITSAIEEKTLSEVLERFDQFQNLLQNTEKS